jgi:hypothetical protein
MLAQRTDYLCLAAPAWSFEKVPVARRCHLIVTGVLIRYFCNSARVQRLDESDLCRATTFCLTSIPVTELGPSPISYNNNEEGTILLLFIICKPCDRAKNYQSKALIHSTAQRVSKHEYIRLSRRRSLMQSDNIGSYMGSSIFSLHLCQAKTSTVTW